MNDPLLTPQRYTRIRELFLQVCELDPLDRSAILDSACADDGDLRSEVESLLREDSHASGIVGEHEQRQHAISSLARRASAAALESLPCVLGRYHLLRVIGEGGMGTVYEAQQLHPQRMVALKVLRPGLITTAMLRRFDYEAHVLGLLQHPGIAQIFEAGTADRGHGEQPFFAMELVRGQPLLKYAAAQTLSVRQKLELMARVCDAVLHAHTKGVVHRDLKPNNILIDESGQPKILDFGVARATDCDIQTTTLHTQVGQLVGTLAYMSPEQAGGNPDEVDTRSDVYSLGVICYELLSGRLPLDLDRKPLHEAVQIIREQESPRLGSIDRAFRGDVETIVAKAMEKEPGRRYQSAAEFVDDLHRWQACVPITARPPGVFYSISRFAARHKVVVGGAVAIAIALIVATAGTSYGLIVSLKERDKALRAEQLADARSQEMARAHDQQAKEAAKSEAVTEFFLGMLTAAEPSHAQGRALTVVDALHAASGRIAQLDHEPEVQAAINAAVGKTFLELGRYADAEPHLIAALETFEELHGPSDANTLAAKGLVAGNYQQLDKLDQASALFQEILEIRKSTLGEHDPQTLRTMNNLAGVFHAQGKLNEAQTLFEQLLSEHIQAHRQEDPQTLRIMNNLALVYGDQRRPADAEPLLRQALEIQSRLHGESHVDTIVTKMNLASNYIQLKQWERAEGLLQSATESARIVLGPTHPKTLTAIGSLGRLYSDQGDFDRAAPYFEESLDVLEQTLGRDHAKTVAAIHNLAGARRGQKRLDEAINLSREAVERGRLILGPDHWHVAVYMDRYGLCLRDAGRYDEAEAQFLEGMGILRDTLGPTHRLTLGATARLVEYYRDRGDVEKAERYRALLPPKKTGSS